MSRAIQPKPEQTQADPRWLAVVERDARADGSFLYSVRTTGVYCRPSCGARTPRPENVAFHETAAAAEQAGFRPCKRCRPDQPSLAQRHAALVADLCRRMETAEEPPKLTELARDAGLSPSHLLRLFKALTGLTPRAYAAARRAGRLRDGLGRTARVTDAIQDAGYGSSGRFYAEADAVLGMTPKRYRAGGAGMTVRFAVGQCALGAILVAASERGICAIFMGDDPEVLIRDLRGRFPRAELAGGDVAFEEWVARVVGFVETPRLGLDLPLDIQGTAFQQRVWRAMREIPPGTTVTYAELAARLGLPKSARAVSGVCAANILAVAIPCHRVVRADGGLAGYRWGVERKQALIEREAGQADQD